MVEFYPEYDKDNIPITLRTKANLNEYDKGTVKLIVSNQLCLSSEILKGNVKIGEFYSDLGIYVDQYYLEKGINREWLSQSVQGKIVCVLALGVTSRMPCDPTLFKIVDAPFAGIFTAIPAGYSKISLGFGEKNIGEVISNSFRYYLHEKSNEFEAYDLQNQNAQKYVYLKRIVSQRAKGDEFEQLEDIHLMMNFLIRKLNSSFTDAEKKVLSSILEEPTNLIKLDNVAIKGRRFKFLSSEIEKK